MSPNQDDWVTLDQIVVDLDVTINKLRTVAKALAKIGQITMRKNPNDERFYQILKSDIPTLAKALNRTF